VGATCNRWTSTGVRAALIAVSLPLAACVQAPPPRAPQPELRVPAALRVRSAGRVVSVPVEDYVVAAALAEVSPVDESPAVAQRIFEVQAVIARTYALAHLGRHQAEGFDLCDETHCQLYDPDRLRTSRFAATARQAAAATAGLVIQYGSRLAESLFHADCGGQLADAHDVWGGPAVPYLRSAPDEVPGLVHRHWSITIGVRALSDALNADVRTRVGHGQPVITIVERDPGGRALEVRLEGGEARTVRGEVFRAVLNRALSPPGLQSTSFQVTRTGESFAFSGRGYGHGVGLCQVGAAARARRGDSLEQILGAYYPGTRLVRLGPAPEMSPEFLLPGRVRPATIP